MLQGAIDTGTKPIDDQRVQFFFHHPINDGGTFCGVADSNRQVRTCAQGGDARDVLDRQHSKSTRSGTFGCASINSNCATWCRKVRSSRALKIPRRACLHCDLHYGVGVLTIVVNLYSSSPMPSAIRTASRLASQRTTLAFLLEEVVGHKLEGTFIMVMNDPRHEYYKTYEVEYDRHTYDGHNWKYVNLPMTTLSRWPSLHSRTGARCTQATT